MTTIENNNKLTAIKMKRTFIAVALCLFSESDFINQRPAPFRYMLVLLGPFIP